MGVCLDRWIQANVLKLLTDVVNPNVYVEGFFLEMFLYKEMLFAATPPAHFETVLKIDMELGEGGALKPINTPAVSHERQQTKEATVRERSTYPSNSNSPRTGTPGMISQLACKMFKRTRRRAWRAPSFDDGCR